MNMSCKERLIENEPPNLDKDKESEKKHPWKGSYV